jgi:aconitate hydratase
MLGLTFVNKNDYDRIKEDDRIDISGLTHFAPGSSLQLTLHHIDGSVDQFPVQHTYSENQIEWFKAGGALNLIRLQQKV